MKILNTKILCARIDVGECDLHTSMFLLFIAIPFNRLNVVIGSKNDYRIF